MRNVVLSKKGDYTLIARMKEDMTVYEYVVAFWYDPEKDQWAQGHYFSDELTKAMDFMYRQRDLEKVSEVLKAIEHEWNCFEYTIKDIMEDESYNDVVNQGLDNHAKK